jgi:tRNA (guanine37-N1)-methyltransferase
MARRFQFVTIHPDFIESYFEFGVFQAAKKKELAQFKTINLRDFAVDKHGSVDDHPYGGGDGMVLRPEPLRDAVKTNPSDRVICLTPSGKLWNQREALSFAEESKSVTFVCGRFGGMDQRFIESYVTDEYSLGDYILSGGELAALCMADSILRFIPGVLGNSESAAQDSFSEQLDGMLEYPLYTRPQVFEDKEVPSVLLSGDHQKIAEWRRDQCRTRTLQRRPDLLRT